MPAVRPTRTPPAAAARGKDFLAQAFLARVSEKLASAGSSLQGSGKMLGAIPTWGPKGMAVVPVTTWGFSPGASLRVGIRH